MRLVPERISRAWVDTLTDEDLIDVEARLHSKFATIERREKKQRGARYDITRGSADLIEAWDRWSRLLNAARERSLKLNRDHVTS